MTALCSAVVASPPVVVGGEGVDQAGNERWAELGGDGIVAPSIEVGKGAIHPTGLPPMLRCGWEGEAASTMILFRSHNAKYPGLPWIVCRDHPYLSA